MPQDVSFSQEITPQPQAFQYKQGIRLELQQVLQQSFIFQQVYLCR